MKYAVLFVAALLAGCSPDELNDKKLMFSFSDDGLGALGTTRIEPESDKVVAIHMDEPWGMINDISKNKVYVSMGQNAEILVYKNYDISDPKILYSTAHGVGPIAIDTKNKKIYWVTTNSGKVYTATLDGKGVQTPLFGGDDLTSHCTGLAVDPVHNKLFLLDAEAKRILVADLSAGTDPTELVTSENFEMDEPHDLVISEDGATLYWVDTNKMLQTNTSTGTTSVFRNSAATHIFIHYPTNHIYVSLGSRVSKTAIGGESTFQRVFEGNAYVDHFVVD